jgi:hypothetical protein
VLDGGGEEDPMIVYLFAAWAADSTVTVPLEVWQASERQPPQPPAVALGAARYQGSADPESMTLDLHLTLEVSLSGDGRKVVPLLGQDVVLEKVMVDGQPAPVTVADGHHVWVTERVGPVRVEVDAWVAPEGGGGSVEYSARVPPTPITSVDLSFPRPDLQPEISSAVWSETSVEQGQTRIRADLGPTDTLGIVGLRAFGTGPGEQPRLYAETRHLVAVDERELDLFTVVRYSILYAPAQQFEVFVPEGLEVVAADGEGAFAWEIVPTTGGSLLRGETTYPMRNRYELSLELARPLPDAATRVVLPTVRGVEREHGWVGIEAPGRVRLESVTGEGLVEVDVHQLPEELKRASVSPLLEGFRSSGEGALQLAARPLPEVEASAERIDRIDAHTVVSDQGRAMTEVVLTLRNRLRPGLSLTLPEGVEIVRTLRDGLPVAPSRASSGEIVVPLRRSAPDAPYVVQIVLSHDLGSLGSLGRETLTLPQLDWAATAVSWQVSLPRGHYYSGLRGDVPTQSAVGWGHWLADDQRGPSQAPASASQLSDTTSDTTTLRYDRYWVRSGEALSVSIWHVRPGMGVLLLLLGGLGAALAAGVLVVGTLRRR